MCPAGAACSNRPCHQLRPPKMDVFLTRNGRGWGVRAAEPIPKGAFVIEYVGACRGSTSSWGTGSRSAFALAARGYK